MKRSRILPIGTPDQPQRADAIEPTPDDSGLRTAGHIGSAILLMLAWGLIACFAVSEWPW